jgi:streptogramin lyase
LRVLGRVLFPILVLLLAGCGLAGEETATPSTTPSPTPVAETATPQPTATATATPTAVPSATPQPTPTPTPTPAGLGWNRFPNVSDLRAVLPVENSETLWLAALSGVVKADLSDEAWTILTEAEGLADNVTVSLARQGSWLWIGTQGGVSRYDLDNKSWRTFTTADGLSSNYNVVVYFDGQTVWAGTRNGLSWYDPAQDRWDSLYTAADIEISGVNALLNDGQYLWISVEPHAETIGGLLRSDLASGDWEMVSGTADGPPTNMFRLAQNESFLWAVPPDGLAWEYEKASKLWRPMEELSPDGLEPGEGFIGPQFYAGALWLYAWTADELVRYEPETRQVSRYPTELLAQTGLQGQMAGRANQLFFPGRNGLVAFNLETGEWQTIRRRVGEVRRILGSREGMLLIDSELGPGFWDPDQDYWRPLAPVGGTGQIMPDAAALEPGTKSVWLAELLSRGPGVETPPRLLYFAEPGVEPQRFDLHPPTDWQVFQLLPQPVGNTLWFIGNRGFLSYNPAIDQWGVFEIIDELFPMVRTFHQAGDTVWFVTETDLGQFNTTTGSHTLTPLPVDLASTAALDTTSERIWLLLNGVLYEGNPTSSDWRQIEAAAPCLDEADQLAVWHDALWVGGTQGVGRFDPAEDTWSCYTPASGMLDQQFQQIVPTADALWFSHVWYGVWRYKDR